MSKFETLKHVKRPKLATYELPVCPHCGAPLARTWYYRGRRAWSYGCGRIQMAGMVLHECPLMGLPELPAPEVG